MKIQNNIFVFFGLARGLNTDMQLQRVSRCFCGSSVRLAGVSNALIFWVVCVNHVDLMTVNAFAMGQCVSDITCQSSLFMLLMYD